MTSSEKDFGDPIDRATAYCTYCPKLCRFSCPAAEAEGRETATPWAMMRLFELVKDGAVEPSQQVAEAFYHCMGCRRCQPECLHENDVPQAMWAARNWLAELGFVPEALADFGEAFCEHDSPHGVAPELGEVHGMDAADIFDETSTVVFMPDCETRYHDPQTVLRVGLLLEIFHGTKVRLYTQRQGIGHGCCGFPLRSAGRDDLYAPYRDALVESLAMADTVIFGCPAAVALHREETSFGEDSPINAVHLIEFLAERIDFVERREPVSCSTAMLHDSCFVGRQLGLYDETRRLLEVLCDAPPREFEYNREEAPCCGAPSHYHVIAPEASERCAQTRIEQMEREGGHGIIASSSTCAKAFRRAGGDDVATTLIEVVCDAFGI